MKEGPCNFCKRKAPRVGGAEDGLDADLFMCGGCAAILKSPVHGPPFLRNHLILETRGSAPEPEVLERVDRFMEAAEDARSRRGSS